MSPDELSHQLAALHAEAFGWALHCCHGDAGLAEDVLQNAYVKCLQGRLRRDGTHLTVRGSIEFGGIVAEELGRVLPATETCFRKGAIVPSAAP